MKNGLSMAVPGWLIAEYCRFDVNHAIRITVFPGDTALQCAGIKRSLMTSSERQVMTMDSVEAYRQSAAQMFDLVPQAGDPADRELLVSMAQRWLELADHWPDQTRRHREAQRCRNY
jgi:hypothetical protein